MKRIKKAAVQQRKNETHSSYNLIDYNLGH